MTPLVLFGLLVAALLLSRGASTAPLPTLEHLPVKVARTPLVFTLAVTMVTLVFFVLSGTTGIPLWLSALAAGVAVLLVVPLLHGTPQDLVRRVDANLLLLFVGLFLLVGSAEAIGLTRRVFALLPLGAPDALGEAARITLVTFIGSNLFSNVPTVLLLDPAIGALGPLHPQLLAAASTLAGNTTLLASAATLIVAEQAEAHGEPFPFWRFTRWGLVVTLITLAVTVPYFVWLGL